MHNFTQLGFASLIACSMLLSCSSSDNNDKADEQLLASSCSVVERNKWINDEMHDAYLWYEYTPDLDYRIYTDPARLLADLRYDKYDRFSYLMNEADYIASQQGRTTAFGFSFGIYNDSRIFRYIHPDSPMAKAGIQRGDQVIKIAGILVEEISSKQFNELLDTRNGPNTQSFTVLHRDTGLLQTHEITSGEFSVKTVFKSHSTTNNGIKSAYLGFSAFMRTSSDELSTAFEALKQENIEELVLDLRYNSGGLIQVSAQLAGLIGGTNTHGQSYATLKYNDRYSNNNYTYEYTLSDHALNLKRVVILTSESTCSASEMLINGLKPFIEVITIGSSSCGKPIGMSPKTACDKTLFAINFESLNAYDEGQFYDGFPANCAVEDYPSGPMWREDDALYSAALYYLANEQCAPTNRSLNSKNYTPITPNHMKVQDLLLF